MTPRIAASILSADFGHIADEVARAEAGGAELVHLDVMDGHFVPNLTMGPAMIRAVRRITTLPLDVHLMISEPDRFLDAFVDAGANMITVHVEAVPHLHRTLSQIRVLGAKAGAALNPSTPVTAVGDVLDQLDYILVMSVNPGFGGQSFIPHSLAKIAQARALCAAAHGSIEIEVDGGVDTSNARSLVTAGATILVAGAAIFGAPDATAAARVLRDAVTRPR